MCVLCPFSIPHTLLDPKSARALIYGVPTTLILLALPTGESGERKSEGPQNESALPLLNYKLGLMFLEEGRKNSAIWTFFCP